MPSLLPLVLPLRLPWLQLELNREQVSSSVPVVSSFSHNVAPTSIALRSTSDYTAGDTVHYMVREKQVFIYRFADAKVEVRRVGRRQRKTATTTFHHLPRDPNCYTEKAQKDEALRELVWLRAMLGRGRRAAWGKEDGWGDVEEEWGVPARDCRGLYRSVIFETKNSILESFRILTLFLTAKIVNLGRSYVTIRIWDNINLPRSTEPIVMCLIKIFHASKRNSIHKLVVSDIDIIDFIAVDIKKIIQNKAKLLAIFTQFINRISYCQGQLFKKLMPRRLLDEKKASITSNRLEISSTGHLITHEVLTFIPIARYPIYISKQYAICTLLKRESPINFLMKIYFPLTKRTIQVNLHNSEIYFEESFTTSILNKKIRKSRLLLIKEGEKNTRNTLAGRAPVAARRKTMFSNSFGYQPRTKKRNRAVSQVFMLDSLTEKQITALDFSGRLYSDFFVNSMKLVDLMLDKARLGVFGKLSEQVILSVAKVKKATQPERIRQAKSYLEHFFWDIVTQGIHFEDRSRNKRVLRFGDFSTVMKELAYSTEVQAKEQVLQIEIHYEVEGQNVKIEDTFGRFRVKDLLGIFYFVRISNLSKGYIRNEKINFYQAFQECKGLYDCPNPLINLHEVIRIARHLADRIIERFIISENTWDQLFSRVVSSTINDSSDGVITLHSRICRQLKIATSEKHTVLFKTVLTRIPRIMSWLLYSQERSIFTVLLYTVHTQSYARIDLAMNYVVQHIPTVPTLLKIGQYLNCGKLMFKAFKNMLMLEFKLIAENGGIDPSCVHIKGIGIPDMKEDYWKRKII